MAIETYHIHWQGIEIEARYEARFSFGTVAHLVIETINPPRARLPITETGFRSHFHQVGMIEAEYDGDVEKAVRAWLDQDSKLKDWKLYVESSKQLALF